MQDENRPSGRRVGTFTLGVVLVVTGILMAVSLFWPQLDLRWAIKGAPFILISLGVETLLAARGDQRVRYDWAGMLLCFLVGLGGLALAAAALGARRAASSTCVSTARSGVRTGSNARQLWRVSVIFL